MTTKDKLYTLLEEQKDSYLSGEEISKQLGLSRAAVWKAVKSLREDGFRIDAVPNKGYCLSSENDLISVPGIRKYLSEECSGLSITVLPCINSTNTYLKEKAADGAPEGTVVVALEQTAGKGRIGRSFHSPAGTGVYFSIVLRPKDMSTDKALRITTIAAVAVSRAIEEVAGIPAEIKWVNDVFVNGKKVCGILTEGSISLENGQLESAVLGIGINAYYPKDEDFPEELRNIMGAVFTEKKGDGKNRLAAATLNHFMSYYRHLEDSDYEKEYRKRCFIIGKDVNVLTSDGSRKAHVLDVDRDCHLIVRYEDGTQAALNSGEVSIRLS